MSTFSGFTHEFGRYICIDNFPLIKSGETNPVAYLLSHAHSDHMKGLERGLFSGKIYCTRLTCELVLQYMPQKERILLASGLREDSAFCRTYQNLNREHFCIIDIGVPFYIELPSCEKVKVTAIDANHCPGSVMFLFESEESSILYTGDIRADPEWCESLSYCKALSPYLKEHRYVPIRQDNDNDEDSDSDSGYGKPRYLDRIYLDTSAFLCNAELVSKYDACHEGVSLLAKYPKDTKFYINLWCAGYEEFLMTINLRFKMKVHTDKYKNKITPEHTTLDGSKTRFHACERKWRCDHVWNNGEDCANFDQEYRKFLVSNGYKEKVTVGCACKGLSCKKEKCEKDESRLVFVNFLEMEVGTWQKFSSYWADTLPDNLVLPYGRHSTLPELQRFVALFETTSLYPNTQHATLQGHDLDALAILFEDYMDVRQLTKEAEMANTSTKKTRQEIQQALAKILNPLPTFAQVYWENAAGNKLSIDQIKKELGFENDNNNRNNNNNGLDSSNVVNKKRTNYINLSATRGPTTKFNKKAKTEKVEDKSSTLLILDE